MSRLRIAPIVEGHGEVEAIRTLLQRTWTEVLGGEHVDVLRPIRQPRSKLIQKRELSRALELALLKLGEVPTAPDPWMVLILIDADKDAPCILGPELLRYARETRPDADVACVLANVEYETWFVAAADSLRGYLNLGPNVAIPEAPEGIRSGKAWIRRHRSNYAETVDQPSMTAKMNLALCRENAPSFDKLCRELEKRLRAPEG